MELGFCYRSDDHGLLWIHSIEYEYTTNSMKCTYKARDSNRQDVPLKKLSSIDRKGIRAMIKHTLLESVREWDSRWIEY